MAKTGKRVLIRYAYTLLEDLVKNVNKELKETKEGVDRNNVEQVLASVWYIDDLSGKIKNMCTIMKGLHQDKAL